jgi:hypothetical protein
MTDDWFEADTWPLEAAIVWLLCGDKRLSGIEATRSLRRRRHQSSQAQAFRARLDKNEKQAARFEVHRWSLYRAEIRDASGGPGAHPIDQAIKQALSILRGVRPATGCCGKSPERTPIPPKTWKLARLSMINGSV